VGRSPTLIIIGGHEDKEDERLILRDLVRRIGDGKLVVATVASREPEEMWETYERVFGRLGVKDLHHLNLDSREDACREKNARALDDAAGVFFTGGDQLKITMLLGGTEIARRIRAIYEDGGVIAGTSAGASVLSDTMIVGGGTGSSARIGQTVRMAPGLGLIGDVLIDQHFAERGRVPRLLGALAQNPRMLGLGIDENTAVVFERHARRFRVVGDGAVYVFNATDMTYANLTEEETDRALSMFGVRIDVLSQGDSFDLSSRRPAKGAAEEIEKEIEGEIAEDAAA
jgi:cyanophycinase